MNIDIMETYGDFFWGTNGDLAVVSWIFHRDSMDKKGLAPPKVPKTSETWKL